MEAFWPLVLSENSIAGIVKCVDFYIRPLAHVLVTDVFLAESSLLHSFQLTESVHLIYSTAELGLCVRFLWMELYYHLSFEMISWYHLYSTVLEFVLYQYSLLLVLFIDHVRRVFFHRLLRL